MNQTYDESTLDQSAIQGLFDGSSPSLIPESLVTTLIVGFVVLNVLGILFVIFYVISLVRKWKVESAVLHMQKDLADIKITLAKQSESTTSAKPHSEITAPPAAQNHSIAQTNLTTSGDDSASYPS